MTYFRIRSEGSETYFAVSADKTVFYWNRELGAAPNSNKLKDLIAFWKEEGWAWDFDAGPEVTCDAALVFSRRGNWIGGYDEYRAALNAEFAALKTGQVNAWE